MLQGLEPLALFSCKIILTTLYIQEIPQSESNSLSFFSSLFLIIFHGKALENSQENYVPLLHILF